MITQSQSHSINVVPALQFQSAVYLTFSGSPKKLRMTAPNLLSNECRVARTLRLKLQGLQCFQSNTIIRKTSKCYLQKPVSRAANNIRTLTGPVRTRLTNISHTMTNSMTKLTKFCRARRQNDGAFDDCCCLTKFDRTRQSCSHM